MEQLRSAKSQEQLMSGVKGVAVKHLHLNVISAMTIIVPPMEEQLAFSKIVKQTDKSKFVAYQETIFIEKILKYTYNHTFRRKNNVH